MTTYVINPITDELESAQPKQTVGDKFKLQTFVRDRFALGSEDPSQEIKTADGEVAGVLFDAFPGSYTDYLKAIDDGFQGTQEDFLKLKSIPQSDRPLTGELDIGEQNMKAIEGQTAFAGLLGRLLKPSDETAKIIKKKKTTKKNLELSEIKKKKPKNYTEAEQIFVDNATKKFQALTANPLYKDLIPKKFKNIKSITELSSSDLKKISRDLSNFQFKSITDEKGLGPYTSLSERLQRQVRGLYSYREKVKKHPNFFSLEIAGDKFDLPYGTGLSFKTFKRFKKIYPALKKLEANPTVENYYKSLYGGKKKPTEKTAERVLINDIQAYLTGVDNRSVSIFDSPLMMKFFKSLDLENKLSKETIDLLKSQKGKEAANRAKQIKATKEAQKVNLAKVNSKSIRRINEIYSRDPDATADDVIALYYGDSYTKASKPKQVRMLKDLRNDIITYYKIAANARKPVKGVRLPSKEKVDDILTTIMESKGRDSFDIFGGNLRKIKTDIAQSITKPPFNYSSEIRNINRKYPGQHIDHTVGLSAIHEAAPGYLEAVQVISKPINRYKGIELDRASTRIINDFFTNTPNKQLTIDYVKYTNFKDKVNAYNAHAKKIARDENIDTAL